MTRCTAVNTTLVTSKSVDVTSVILTSVRLVIIGVRGFFDEKKLRGLRNRRRPLVAVLEIHKSPYSECEASLGRMEKLSGIEIRSGTDVNSVVAII